MTERIKGPPLQSPVTGHRSSVTSYDTPWSRDVDTDAGDKAAGDGKADIDTKSRMDGVDEAQDGTAAGVVNCLDELIETEVFILEEMFTHIMITLWTLDEFIRTLEKFDLNEEFKLMITELRHQMSSLQLKMETISELDKEQITERFESDKKIVFKALRELLFQFRCIQDTLKKYRVPRELNDILRNFRDALVDVDTKYFGRTLLKYE